MATPFIPPRLFSDPVDGDRDTPGPGSTSVTDVNGLITVDSSSSNRMGVAHINQPLGETQSGPGPSTDDVTGRILDDDDSTVDKMSEGSDSFHTVASDETATVDYSGVDLVKSIQGMYRILDLISEQSSGGLVDKIIISQSSLGRFVNDMCPGAYASMTQVDFTALDDIRVKPIGIYGSKIEIVRFLQEKGVVDDALAEVLRVNSSQNVYASAISPSLRSGLYILRILETQDEAEVIYVIYWPEDDTWDVDAITSVRRNRVTFMRYLTKIADQVVSLISDEDASKIVWKDEVEEDMMHDDDDDDDESDRMFMFEVAKTREQEENVVAREGWKVDLPSLAQGTTATVPALDEDTLRARLIPGETVHGLLQCSYTPSNATTKPLQEVFNEYQLRQTINEGSLELNEDMPVVALDLLILHGLRSRAPDAHDVYQDQKAAAIQEANSSVHQKNQELQDRLKAESDILGRAVHQNAALQFVKLYPSFGDVLPAAQADPDVKKDDQSINILTHLSAMYPGVQDVLRSTADPKTHTIQNKSFQALKERIIILDHILQHQKSMAQEKQRELIDGALKMKNMTSVADLLKAIKGKSATAWFGIPAAVKTFFSDQNEGSSVNELSEAQHIASGVDDPEFFSILPTIVNRNTLLTDAVQDAIEHARQFFTRNFPKLVDTTIKRIRRIQEDECKRQIKREAESQKVKDIEAARIAYLRALKDELRAEKNTHHHIKIDVVEEEKKWRYSSSSSFIVRGLHRLQTEASLAYTLSPFQLTEDNKHRAQLDSSFVPTPKITRPTASSFDLPVGHSILYMQLLANDKCLLVLDEGRGSIKIFLENYAYLNNALKPSRNAQKKILHRERIGQHCLFAFDEIKRMFALLSLASNNSAHPQLYIFTFDETYNTLQALGSAFSFATWYDSPVHMVHMAFVCGSEELVLVDSTARARIFSVVTQQFSVAAARRHAERHLYGACLFTLHHTFESAFMRAYHWSTFGSSKGLTVDVTIPSTDSFIITSLSKRTDVYAVGLNIKPSQCFSMALGITRKATEFTFQEKRGRYSEDNGVVGARNIFVDCHRDVWTRFPVVPAVRRQTISSHAQRFPRSLVFVAPRDHTAYATYYAGIVASFEHSTRKPTGRELSKTRIVAMSYVAFSKSMLSDVSSFCAGEWLVDLLCLIPIHLAITRDNRFIPLKDGVISNELERSLLGADVARIVDSLSFGWYESLFNSYMATKPVKVVSSMGEQSVGKSFALNHLVDTSFAGSAMRTTEGVWMSVAPLKDMIIVALDFEGVHSIERSAQEDTLLVLFNTAISNMVLFRNNFALSRDITGLFKSFQSSSSVLDPTTNPTLFRSVLVIIIKYVVDSDTKDIVKEFKLKFQQIVQLEQASNFISQLHRGQLAIVPWPVIESREFYTLFNKLKGSLDKQVVTHPGGGIFLQTLKTLMAKLKANDWGALSQNMASHRAKLLRGLLPNALSFGAAEVVPEYEPLKDLDTGTIVDKPDGSAKFFLSEIGSTDPSFNREIMLHSLIITFPHFHERFPEAESEWMAALQAHICQIAQNRVEHIEEWLALNVARYPSEHSEIQSLRWAANNLIIDLRANIQLCTLQCASCHLLCILGRHHEGLHDCQTSHQCKQDCAFEGHEDVTHCGLFAGHPGQHVCDITAHLCGKPCMLDGRRGCLRECTKMVNHEDEEHLCPATVHECGQPCSLANVQLSNGTTYTCLGVCRRPSHEPHTVHLCDNRQCPLQCQLCKRLCADTDHLHGLDHGVTHLCGQEHTCGAQCAAHGICQIDTSPQSIEATFTGRHETFQYTKYTQVSKRLPCVIPIPPGEVSHLGSRSHCHSLDIDAFHFCEARCENCGYFCTLRLGHPQNEHETSHGSMSRTQWAIDGNEDDTYELDGRKFGISDEGAPMLCSMVCRSMGRHVHIDYCRADPGEVCSGPDHEHITARMRPNPGRAKDWVTHSLFWRRTGFKDPYPHEDQLSFALCNAMCAGPEHTNAGPNGATQPSYCTLPILHARQTLDQAPPNNGLGYISNDGHAFMCRNPVVLQQAFHVIFVIDRSGSMGYSDRQPLANTPRTALISRRHNNRLGAVYSSLFAFLSARQTVAHAGARGQAAIRRDAYTIVLFDQAIVNCVENDFSRAPDELLDALLRYTTGGGTNFTLAVGRAQALMERHWSTDRSPVVIFLSDGECGIGDEVMQDLCRRAIALGKPLSFHAVSFGPHSQVLQRMAQVALDVQNRAQPDPANPVPSSTYAEALDSVRLAETFLGIAESLRKPRGSLLHV